MTKDQFKSMFRKCYKERDDKECERIKDRISEENYFACPPNPSDSSCCMNPSSCVSNGVCFPDGAIMRLTGDPMNMKCVAHSPGQWVPDFETDCSNVIDDDLDGLVDCADPDCNGNLNGIVLNDESKGVPSATINVKNGQSVVQNAVTGQDGTYTTSTNCGFYNVVASHASYVPQTKSNILIPARGDASANFSLIIGTSCESDCTFNSDNLIHESCDGINGCYFFDSTSRAACDLAQPGWIRNYDSGNYVVCPSGSPQPKVEVQATISCTSGTLVKVTRIVIYNGKPVKLIVATCG